MKVSDLIKIAHGSKWNRQEGAQLFKWDELVESARRGDYGALCAILDEPDLELRQPHLGQLSRLIRDAIVGDLKRRHRVRKSNATRIYENRWTMMVVHQLRDIEKKRGKQFRGDERTSTIEKLINQLPLAKRLRPKAANVAKFIKNNRTQKSAVKAPLLRTR
jgi:hypothetical protein